MDGDKGLSIQDCAAISRHVGYHLEEENLLSQAYNLEVSSPGVDTPLRSMRQYLKNTGRSISLKLKDGSKAEGKLLKTAAEHITILETKKEKDKKAQAVEHELAFVDIIESKVLISFK